VVELVIVHRKCVEIPDLSFLSAKLAFHPANLTGSCAGSSQSCSSRLNDFAELQQLDQVQLRISG